MKTCTKCLEVKSLAEFHTQRGKPRPRCKKCTNAENVARQASQPEKATARVNAWRAANPEKHSNQTKRRRRLKPELFKRNNYWTNFRIEFFEEWERQGGLCAACGNPMLQDGREPDSVCADHDRTCCTGKTSCGACFRGLIHRNCNLTLGHAKDNPEILRAAIRYLSTERNARSDSPR